MHKHRNLIALAVACACTNMAHADVIDINALVVTQLKKANKLDAIYRIASKGQPLPAGINASAIFQGQVGGQGVVFKAPPIIPVTPLSLATKPIQNCSSRDVTFKAIVNKKSSNSTTIANSDTVATGREISVTVGYDSPFGASASSTATASQSFSATTSREQSKSEELGWQDELEVPVEAGKQVKVEFVVSEQRLDRVPYTANLVLSGDVAISFLKGEEGFRWVRIQGSQLPQNVIRPGVQQNNRRLGVCRVNVGNKVRIGKSEGTTCWFGLSEQMPMGLPRMGKSTGDFEILVGSDSSVRLGEPYADDAYQGDDAGRTKVCFAQTDQGWSLPGYIEGRECISEWDSKAVATQKYKVLRTAGTGGLVATVKLDDYLSVADRTFNLRGIFTGVNAVSGDFLIGPSLQAACPKTVTAAATTGPAALGAGAKLAPPVMLPVALDSAKKGEAMLPMSASVKTVKPKR